MLVWNGKGRIENLQSPIKTVGILKGNKVENVIIAMHGFGDTAANFSSLAHEIPVDNILWLFPQGPRSVPQNLDGAQWFSLFENPNSERKTSENFISQLCHNVSNEIDLPMEKIFFMGFSQGASMALSCGLKISAAVNAQANTRTQKIGGIVALSGFMMQQTDIKDLLTENEKNIPIFLAHGRQDQVVFPAFFYETQNALKNIGMKKLTAKIYNMGHNISPEELLDLRKFIEENRL